GTLAAGRPRQSRLNPGGSDIRIRGQALTSRHSASRPRRPRRLMLDSMCMHLFRSQSLTPKEDPEGRGRSPRVAYEGGELALSGGGAGRPKVSVTNSRARAGSTPFVRWQGAASARTRSGSCQSRYFLYLSSNSIPRSRAMTDR